jgi:hypothetical protein
MPFGNTSMRLKVLHNPKTFSEQEHEQTIKEIFALFKKYYNSTPIYFALGNHEGVPINW